MRHDIRPALPADAPALAALKRTTFRDTFVEDFAIPYPPDDLRRFEALSYGEATIRAELADRRHETWVAAAADDGALLGYVHFGPCKLPHPDVRDGEGEIYQLYVSRSAQGLGIGRRLLSIAIERLAATRPGPAWLGVWSGNHRAQAIYAARGFVPVGEYRFAVGDWCDEELILRLDPPARAAPGD
jgi:ribosomal protein S18 acetylase RimI-like enzyme